MFPLTSLVCLIGLAVGQKLPAAIATHLNAEAISNAVFQPVNNANYAALPLRFHGRVRTLADGVFYPAGLALAGVMLLSLQDRLALAQVTFIAIVFALVFILLNVGVGRAVPADPACATCAPGSCTLPTLRRAPGAAGRVLAEQDRASCCAAPIPRRGRSASTSPSGSIRRRLLAELRELAPSADRPSRRRLVAALLARAPAAAAGSAARRAARERRSRRAS